MKMKSQNNIVYLSFFCAVFCFSWSTQDKINVRMPAPLVLKARAEAERCEKETGVPAAHLRKIMDGSLPDDLPNKQFFYCVSLNKYNDAEGHLLVDKMANWEVDGSMEEYKKAVQDCNRTEKGNPLDTLFETANCIRAIYNFTLVTPQ